MRRSSIRVAPNHEVCSSCMHSFAYDLSSAGGASALCTFLAIHGFVFSWTTPDVACRFLRWGSCAFQHCSQNTTSQE